MLTNGVNLEGSHIASPKKRRKKKEGEGEGQRNATVEGLDACESCLSFPMACLLPKRDAVAPALIHRKQWIYKGEWKNGEL